MYARFTSFVNGLNKLVPGALTGIWDLFFLRASIGEAGYDFIKHLLDKPSGAQIKESVKHCLTQDRY